MSAARNARTISKSKKEFLAYYKDVQGGRANPKEKFICYQDCCLTLLSSSTGVSKHVSNVHSGPFPCGFVGQDGVACSKTFAKMQNRSDHLRAAHLSLQKDKSRSIPKKYRLPQRKAKELGNITVHEFIIRYLEGNLPNHADFSVILGDLSAYRYRNDLDFPSKGKKRSSEGGDSSSTTIETPAPPPSSSTHQPPPPLNPSSAFLQPPSSSPSTVNRSPLQSNLPPQLPRNVDFEEQIIKFNSEITYLKEQISEQKCLHEQDKNKWEEEKRMFEEEIRKFRNERTRLDKEYKEGMEEKRLEINKLEQGMEEQRRKFDNEEKNRDFKKAEMKELEEQRGQLSIELEQLRVRLSAVEKEKDVFAKKNLELLGKIKKSDAANLKLIVEKNKLKLTGAGLNKPSTPMEGVDSTPFLQLSTLQARCQELEKQSKTKGSIKKNEEYKKLTEELKVQEQLLAKEKARVGKLRKQLYESKEMIDTVHAGLHYLCENVHLPSKLPSSIRENFKKLLEEGEESCEAFVKSRTENFEGYLAFISYSARSNAGKFHWNIQRMLAGMDAFDVEADKVMREIEDIKKQLGTDCSKIGENGMEQIQRMISFPPANPVSVEHRFGECYVDGLNVARSYTTNESMGIVIRSEFPSAQPPIPDFSILLKWVNDALARRAYPFINVVIAANALFDRKGTFRFPKDKSLIELHRLDDDDNENVRIIYAMGKSYDDHVPVVLAYEFGGIIISNDRFRDLFTQTPHDVCRPLEGLFSKYAVKVYENAEEQTATFNYEHQRKNIRLGADPNGKVGKTLLEMIVEKRTG